MTQLQCLKNIDGNFKVSPTHTNSEKPDLLAFTNNKNDEEEFLNRPINPLLDDKNLIIQMIGDMEQDEPNIWINAKLTTSQLLHQTHDEKKKVVPLKEQIPEEYHEFLDIFDEKKADHFPEEQVWDHKIELKDGFVPKSFKNYNLTPIEQIKLDKFLKENLEKGYIRPSQSPMALPFFFVNKKEAGKLRPCHLEAWRHYIQGSGPTTVILSDHQNLTAHKEAKKLNRRQA